MSIWLFIFFRFKSSRNHGIAGFIGFHVAKKLCDQGHDVIAIDSINNYYDEDLKNARLENLGIKNSQKNFRYEYPHW